jgi:hypothetical protein
MIWCSWAVFGSPTRIVCLSPLIPLPSSIPTKAIFSPQASLASQDGKLLVGNAEALRGRLRRPSNKSTRGWALGLPPSFGASPASSTLVWSLLFHPLALCPSSPLTISGGPLVILPTLRQYRKVTYPRMYFLCFVR